MPDCNGVWRRQTLHLALSRSEPAEFAAAQLHRAKMELMGCPGLQQHRQTTASGVTSKTRYPPKHCERPRRCKRCPASLLFFLHIARSANCPKMYENVMFFAMRQKHVLNFPTSLKNTIFHKCCWIFLEAMLPCLESYENLRFFGFFGNV